MECLLWLWGEVGLIIQLTLRRLLLAACCLLQGWEGCSKALGHLNYSMGQGAACCSLTQEQAYFLLLLLLPREMYMVQLLF